MTLRQPRPATLLFAAAASLSAGLLLHWMSEITFWRDEWAFLLHRRGTSLDVIFDPFVEQLLAIPIVLYKLLVAGFGMDSPRPFQIPAVVMFVASVATVWLYLRRRVGEWVALAGVLPLLFLGQAWDDLLFPFQVSFFGSIACGMGALLLVERDHRRADVAAAALLVLALLFSDLGIPFVAAATLSIAFTPRRFARAWVVAIPTAVFGLWYLGWGHEAQTFVSLENLATTPAYILDGFASSLSSLLGLGVPRDELTVSTLDWGRPLLVLLGGLAVWRVVRAGSISRGLWVALALGVGFWFLAGLNSSSLGPPTAGRYQFIGAVFVLLIAAELARGSRLRGWGLAAVFAVAGLAALSNLSYLENAAGGLAGIAEKQRGGLAALELIRDRVDPAFLLTPENSDVDYLGEVDAGSYLAAVDDYGSPAYTPEELATAPEAARVAADKVFAAGLGIELAPVPASSPDPRLCSRALVGVGARKPAGALLPLESGGALVEAGGADVDLRLRRYATASSPVELGRVAGGERALLEIPADGSAEPWELELAGSGPVRVCQL